MLETRISELAKRQETPSPRLFNVSDVGQRHQLEQLLENRNPPKIIDTYQSQLEERLIIEKPWLNFLPEQREKDFSKFVKDHTNGKPLAEAGVWAYLPWRNTLLHLLEDTDYQQVRTARNRNLITAEEQEKYYNSTIGIAGLSVGNSVALSIVLTGGGKNLRLADPDTLELTNLNRIRGSITELTEPKVHMTARQIYELDPYANLTLYEEGLTEENINEFFDGLDIVIDEIDNIGMKIRIRQEAAKRNIPVVMAADNGDGGVLDVERHDLEDNIPIFHGRTGQDIADRVLNQKLPLPEIGRIITEELIGARVVTPRMQQSLLSIGKTIPTWPQLGSAANLNGAVVAAVVRRILTGQDVIRNRTLLSTEALITPNYNSQEQKNKRKKSTEDFLIQYHEQLEQAKASISPK